MSFVVSFRNSFMCAQLRLSYQLYNTSNKLLKASFAVVPNHPPGEFGTSSSTSSSDEDVVEATKRMAGAASDIGMEVGERAKKTMDNAWESAKETTRNVKDAVLEDPKNPNQELRNRKTDSGVEDLRKHGYD